jgi:putative RecB family exonuclease
MALEPPHTLSPSKVSSFTDCALAFRFSAIDRLPEPPSVAATKGTLVHAALERLYDLPPAQRTVDTALVCLAEAMEHLRDDPEFSDLDLRPEDEAAFLVDADRLVRNDFVIEDPASVQPIGLELMLQAEIGGVMVRGIIDRLELDHDGGLVVTDYKTGRSPNERYELGRMGGVHLYSLLCEKVFGQRPARVRLLYLGDPLEISTSPSAQSTAGIERKVGAIWTAVERACEREDFRPRPGKLCDWCAFQAYCPAFGGDPDEATKVATARREAAAALRDETASVSALALAL